MKKRKIRYDRILLPILILCVIIFGISSCHKTEEVKVQSKPIHTTTTFLKNALKPVGQTLDSGNLKITNLDRLIFTKNGEFTI